MKFEQQDRNHFSYAQRVLRGLSQNVHIKLVCLSRMYARVTGKS